MEPPPVGMTYLGPVTSMKSAETQTDYVFGSDGLFVEAVARAVAKKLLLEEPSEKKLNLFRNQILKLHFFPEL